MLAMPRLRMVASTRGVRAERQRCDVEIRPFTASDFDETSRVLVAAYKGTSEAEADDDQELGRFLNNDWGPTAPEATFVAIDPFSKSIIGASLVCHFEDEPLVAHLVVLREWRGRGIAGSLVRASADALLANEHPHISLAVSAKNLNALRTYARLGFGLFAPEATASNEGVRYQTRACFTAVSNQIEAAAPDLEVANIYGVGVKRSGSTTIDWPHINVTPDHLLPGRILALITGWRSGDAEIPITPSMFDAAIALLTPAGSATFFDHPNLTAWQALRSTLQLGDVPTVRFASTSSEN
jgi:ribosomal protein S18 acetylase RimI-like enzyme